MIYAVMPIPKREQNIRRIKMRKEYFFYSFGGIITSSQISPFLCLGLINFYVHASFVYLCSLPHMLRRVPICLPMSRIILIFFCRIFKDPMIISSL